MFCQSVVSPLSVTVGAATFPIRAIMMIRLRLRVVSCERGNWSYFWCVVVREHGLVLVDQSLGRLTRLYTILSLVVRNRTIMRCKLPCTSLQKSANGGGGYLVIFVPLLTRSAASVATLPLIYLRKGAAST